MAVFPKNLITIEHQLRWNRTLQRFRRRRGDNNTGLGCNILKQKRCKGSIPDARFKTEECNVQFARDGDAPFLQARIGSNCHILQRFHAALVAKRDNLPQKATLSFPKQHSLTSVWRLADFGAGFSLDVGGVGVGEGGGAIANPLPPTVEHQCPEFGRSN
jgi:hypothetical protein